MKVLFINYEFPPLGGGGGRANAHIAREMVALGHKVSVLTSSFKGLAKEEIINGFKVFRIPTLRKYQEKCRVYEMLAFLIMSFIYAPRIAKKTQADLCIAFFTIPSGPAAWLLKKLYKIPLIISLRGGDVPGFMGKKLSFYHRLAKPFIKKLWKDADHVVANSFGLKDLALLTSPHEEIQMIPNGVNRSFFSKTNSDCPPSLKESILFRSSKLIHIISVGRFSEQKDYITLLKALPFIKASFHLSLVGDGPLRSQLESFISENSLESKVSLLGWLEPSEIRSVYEKADIFVLPSIDEGMPNVVLEAMSMGLPIVATDITGSRELVEDGVNGKLIPVSEPEQLAVALEELILEQKKRQSMALSSLEKIKNYDWRRVASSYLSLSK